MIRRIHNLPAPHCLIFGYHLTVGLLNHLAHLSPVALPSFWEKPSLLSFPPSLTSYWTSALQSFFPTRFQSISFCLPVCFFRNSLNLSRFRTSWCPALSFIFSALNKGTGDWNWRLCSTRPIFLFYKLKTTWFLHLPSFTWVFSNFFIKSDVSFPCAFTMLSFKER